MPLLLGLRNSLNPDPDSDFWLVPDPESMNTVWIRNTVISGLFFYLYQKKSFELGADKINVVITHNELVPGYR